MNAKLKVKQVYPQARHRRYQTTDGQGYTLIFADNTAVAARLSEADTTAKAWARAWKFVKSRQQGTRAKEESSQTPSASAEAPAS